MNKPGLFENIGENLPPLERLREVLQIDIGRPTGAMPHLFVNEAGRCVEVFLEDVPFYGEWIRGEGADICLHRAQDDNRIVGATLPLTSDRKRAQP